MKVSSLMQNSVVLAVTIVTSAIVTGCTNRGAQTAPTVSTTSHATLMLPEPAEPKIAIPSKPAKKNYRIGVSLLTQDDPFYISLKNGLVKEATKEHVTLTALSADKDLNKQINQVQSFITEKDDAIVVCPVDSTGIIAAVQAANQAHIPVFTADITADGGKVVSAIASDNVEGGKLVGDYVAKKLLKGTGNVAILDLKTITSVQDRVKGFKEALAAYPGIKIVADENVPGATRENAVNKATDLLTATPNINVIFGINDPVALGTLSALQQMNKTGVDVVGFDGTPEAQNYISSGTSPLKADAIQFPDLIGVTTVDAIVRYLNGQSLPPKVPIPTGLVTKSTFKH